MFIKNGIQLAAVGWAIGLGTSFLLLSFLTKMLLNLPGNDPWFIIAVSFLLVATVLLAGWFPARWATKVDPTVALRSE